MVITSSLDDSIISDPAHVILGDSGYEGTFDFIDVPFKRSPGNTHVNPQQKAFNCMHSYLRSTVEHVFGDIDKLFSVMQRPKRIHFRIQPVVTLACYLLYNFTKGRRGYVDEAKIAFLERVKTGLEPEALLQTQLLQYDGVDEED